MLRGGTTQDNISPEAVTGARYQRIVYKIFLAPRLVRQDQPIPLSATWVPDASQHICAPKR